MPKILIVDDDRAARHLLRKTLLVAGLHRGGRGQRCRGARAARASRRFDVMLLDLWMPKMTGLDLLAKLRTRKTGPRSSS